MPLNILGLRVWGRRTSAAADVPNSPPLTAKRVVTAQSFQNAKVALNKTQAPPSTVPELRPLNEEYEDLRGKILNQSLDFSEKIPIIEKVMQRRAVMRLEIDGESLLSAAFDARRFARTPEQKETADLVLGQIQQCAMHAVVPQERPAHRRCAGVFSTATRRCMLLEPEARHAHLVGVVEGFVRAHGNDAVAHMVKQVETSPTPLETAQTLILDKMEAAFASRDQLHEGLQDTNLVRFWHNAASDLVLMAEAKKVGYEVSTEDFAREHVVIGRITDHLQRVHDNKALAPADEQTLQRFAKVVKAMAGLGDNPMAVNRALVDALSTEVSVTG